ncbi:MAG: hypothetical protein LBU23_00060 [Planctomycetota bacterium]|jgi:hypothetical protein|nr:hypothetical protein [Planctomycetota bacterium]
MSSLNRTLGDLAPRVAHCRDLPERYNPKHCLAIYYLSIPDYSPSAPVMALGEVIAARNGIGCVILEGVPAKIPEGAAIIAKYPDLMAIRPDLLEGLPALDEPEQYAVRIGQSVLIVSPSIEGLVSGIQTLTMLILRHGEPTLPGGLILDRPACQSRGLAVELTPDEINVGLLLQIASFAATFKANRLHLILPAEFNSGLEIPGLETFVQTCRSYGIAIGVRLPWLSGLLSGKRPIPAAWAGIRAAAEIFGADRAALDDPCPPDADPAQAEKIMASILNGDTGLKAFSLDARLIRKSACPVPPLEQRGIAGWFRMDDQPEPPPPELSDIPLWIDAQAPVMGFSNHGAAAYHRRLDSAMLWLRSRTGRGLMISFRNARVGCLWQNLMHPAATGLIAAWGNPRDAGQSSQLFANLLYSDMAPPVLDMWDAVSAAYPPGLSLDEERLLRHVAFGRWPEDERTLQLLAGIDWLATIRGIRAAADKLKKASEGLSRNAATLSGARLCLQALSWLCSFASLVPELERLRQTGSPPIDDRGAAMARELLNNFTLWSGCLRNMPGESGQRAGDPPILGDMRLRLEELCRGMA